MIKEINTGNLHALCRGSSFLGSGGGGSEKHLRSTVEKALEQWGPVPLLSVDDLDDNDCIVSIELFGSPFPFSKKHEFEQLLIQPVLDLAMKDIGKSIKALMPVEIGGVNALTPLCVAGSSGLPVLDADLLGRSFPEMYMSSINVYGMMPECVYVSNPHTGESSVLACSSYADLEEKGRLYAQQCPNQVAVMIPNILTGRQAKRAVLPGTVNQSIRIGQQTLLADLLQAVQGAVQCTGKVVEYNYELKGGFLLGQLLIQTQEGGIIKIRVKNEYLHLSDGENNVLIEAPDIISLMRASDLTPLLSDQIIIGDEVICITCKGHELWYTDQGLAVLRSNDKPKLQQLSMGC